MSMITVTNSTNGQLLEVRGSDREGWSGHGKSTATTAIKPCPFCGSHEVEITNTHEPSYWAECDACGAHGPSGRPKGFDFGRIRSRTRCVGLHIEAFTNALRLWNTRKR